MSMNAEDLIRKYEEAYYVIWSDRPLNDLYHERSRLDALLDVEVARRIKMIDDIIQEKNVVAEDLPF